MLKHWLVHVVCTLALATVLMTGISVASAAPLKVMTFNTMCDVCKGFREYEPFSKRLGDIADTIRRHDPDLVSLQEVRTKNQLRRLSAKLKNRYQFVFASGFPLSYADPALLVKKERFRVLKRSAGWLGPNWPKFSMGWRVAIPRRLQYVELEDRIDQSRFGFAGTHFDNHGKNKEPSARLVSKLFQAHRVPVIFAGDLNLKPEMTGYTTLQTAFRDTFHDVTETRYFANGPYEPNEACQHHETQRFPECRIDHVLLSNDSPWRTKSWGVDVHRYSKKNNFTSDHRAVIVELE